nr:MAG TPA: hypothetical protein [Caudoviricetes sp.]
MPPTETVHGCRTTNLVPFREDSNGYFIFFSGLPPNFAAT